jgi:hypothetical protein
MATDGFITIRHVTTAAEAQMLTELLRGEGIAARCDALTGAQLGMGQQAFALSVDVPAESLARASALLADLEYAGASPEGAEALQDDEPAPAKNARRPKLAAGVAFLFPGGGHLHARRPWTALPIGTTLLAGWLTSFGFLRWEASFAGEMLFGALIALVLCDSIGGARAAMAENRGIHPSRPRQLARAFVLIAGAGAAGAAFATVASIPRLVQARRLARFETRCTPGSVEVTNGDQNGRVLFVSRLVFRVWTSPDIPTGYALGPERSAQLEVAPGKSGRIDFAVPEWTRQTCARESCDLVFELEAAHPDDAAVAKLEAYSICVPHWDQPGTARQGYVEQSPVR